MSIGYNFISLYLFFTFFCFIACGNKYIVSLSVSLSFTDAHFHAMVLPHSSNLSSVVALYGRKIFHV